MHCNALKFHKLWPTSRRRRCRRGGRRGANLCHTYSDFRFPQHVPRPIRECVILAAVEKGIIAKVNSRQNGQWLWLWPTYWAKIVQLVTRTLPARVIKRENEREIEWEGDSLKMDISKGARAENIRVIVAQNSRLVSKELTREREREEGEGKGQQKREGDGKKTQKNWTEKQKRGKTVIFVSNSWTTVHVHVELSLTAATKAKSRRSEWRAAGNTPTHALMHSLQINIAVFLPPLPLFEEKMRKEKRIRTNKDDSCPSWDEKLVRNF